MKRIAQLRLDTPEAGAQLSLEQLDGRDLCTHVLLCGPRVLVDGHIELATSPARAQRALECLKQVAEFRRRNANIRVIVSLGASGGTGNNPQGTAASGSTVAANNIHNNSSHTPHSTATTNGHNGAASPMGPLQLAELTRNQDKRQRFVRKLIEFIRTYQLDGLDLDWSLVGAQLRETAHAPHLLGAAGHHASNGALRLVSALRGSMVEDYYARQVTAQRVSPLGTQAALVEPHLLTVSISAHEASFDAHLASELRQLYNLCDWLHLLTYDYYLFRAYTPLAGPIAPLNPIVSEYVPILNKLSLASTLGRLLACLQQSEPHPVGTGGGGPLEQAHTATAMVTHHSDAHALPATANGGPNCAQVHLRDKLVVAVAAYARAYRLVFRAGQASALALALGNKPGNQLNDSDALTRPELDELLNQPNAQVEFDERARVPYALADEGCTWVSFENERSICEKIDFIGQQRLAGCMTCSLNADYSPLAADPLGQKIPARFPVHEMVRDAARRRESLQQKR